MAAFTPVLLNVAIISSAIYLHQYVSIGAYALAIGVFIGGAVQLAFQLPFLYRAKMLVKPRWGWQDPWRGQSAKTDDPSVIWCICFANQPLSRYRDCLFLVTGSIARLYYADRLIEFPLGLFGIGIATVILPTLSKLHAGDKGSGFSAHLRLGVRFEIFLGLPAMLGLMVISPLIITVLFDHGAFASAEVIMSAQCVFGVAAYAVGLVSFMLIKVLAPGFYARQDTRTPVRIGIIAMVLNMVFNLLLAPFIGYLGLALATALSATCNALLLYRQLAKEQVYHFSKTSVIFTGKCLFATACMGAAVYALQSQFMWQQWPFYEQIALLAGLIFVAMSCYFGVLFIMGVRPSMIKNVATTESH